MVVPSAAQLQAFNGGQMTDLPEFGGVYDPTALIEIVSPGNEVNGVNYSVPLSDLFSFPATPTILLSGATIGDPYVALAADTRILVNKTLAAASYISLGSPLIRGNAPIMVRDLKGDANVRNITVSFTGTCDGLASPIVIDAPYGGWVFNPLADGNWYLTST